MSTLASMFVALGVDPTGVDKGLGHAETRLGAFTNKMNRAGGALTKGLTLPILAVGGFALKAALDVDGAYDIIQAGTGATGKKLDGLEQVFDRVAKKTPADLESIANTVTDLNRRLDLTGPTLGKLSQQVLEAGRMQGAEVNIRAVTSAFSAFDVQGKDTVAGMDDLFRISQATGLGINDLTGILAKSAPILKQLGFGFKDSAAMVGILDKAGINSRAVMSSMSAGLVKLAKDGEAPNEAFHRVSGRLQELVDKGRDAKALELAAKIFGTRGAGQFIAALQSGKVSLDDLTKSAGLGGDSILKVADKTKDFPEIWQEFKNKAALALAPIAAEWMPKIADGLIALAGYLDSLMTWWDGLSESTQGFILKALAVVAVLGPMLMVTAKMISTLQTLSGVVTVFRSIWLSLNILFAASPIGFIIVAVVALVAALVLAYKKSETFRNIVNTAFASVKNTVGPVLEWIVEKVKAGWDKVSQWTSTAWGNIKTFVKGGVDRVEAIIDGIRAIPDRVRAWWENLQNKTQAVFAAVVAVVMNKVNGVLDAIRGLAEIPGKVGEWFGRMKDAAAEKTQALLAYVKDTPNRVKSNLGNLGHLLWDAGVDIIQGLLDGIGSMVGKVKDKLGELTDLIPDWKGPAAKDKKLLWPTGRMIIGGLIDGIVSKNGDLKAELGKITDLIAKTMARRYDNDKKAAAATKAVMRGLADERAALINNARQHDRAVAKLQEARQAYKDLSSEAREYARAVRDSVVAYGDVTQFGDHQTGKVTAKGILAGLKKRLFDSAAYGAALQELAGLGLNKTSLEQIKAAGVDGGLATAKAILEGGQVAVDQINSLTDQLTAVGTNLGDSLADTMYGSGLEAARALVESLEDKVADLERTGRKLAKAFVQALQDELEKVHVEIPGLDVDDVYTNAKKATKKHSGGSSGGSTTPPPPPKAPPEDQQPDKVVDAINALGDTLPRKLRDVIRQGDGK